MKPVYSGSGLIGWFASNPVAANLLMLLVIIAGLFQAAGLRKEAFPQLPPSKIQIDVRLISGSAQQAEEGIAIPVEQALEGLPGIASLKSSSSASGSRITVEGVSGDSLDALFERVSARVESISRFPQAAERPLVTRVIKEQPAIWLEVYGHQEQHVLQRLAADLRKDLLAKAEISRVDMAGWATPELVMDVHPARLRAYGLGLNDLEMAIRKHSLVLQQAEIQGERLFLRLDTSEQQYSIAEFNQIPVVAHPSGFRLTLGQLADIREQYPSQYQISRFQGQRSIGLQVVTTDQDDISQSVSAAMAVVSQWHTRQRLPESVSLAAWQDRSQSIEQRLRLITENAIFGALLVFLVLALFLNVTVAFWVGAGLPFVLFGTLFFMGEGWLNLTLNEFTTFGFIMALGLVVDDAVVVGESIYHQRVLHGDTLRNTIKGAMRVALPTSFGMLTTAVAFFSLTQVEGQIGQLYVQFASIVTLCLILSLVETKLILPAHLRGLRTTTRYAADAPKRETKILAYWERCQSVCSGALNSLNQRVYGPALGWLLSARYLVLSGFILLLLAVLALPLTGVVHTSFYPDILGDRVNASVQMHPDVSFDVTERALAQLEAQAYEADRILGEGGIAHLRVEGSRTSGRLWVELHPDARYNIKEFAQAWRATAGRPEGLKSLRIRSKRELVSSVRLNLRSNQIEELEAALGFLKEQIQMMPAISAVEDSLAPSLPTLKLRLNPLGEALGLTPEDLASHVFQGFGGQVIQRFQQPSGEVEVKLGYIRDASMNISQLLESHIRLPTGRTEGSQQSSGGRPQIPLSQVSLIDYSYSRASIQRINGMRAVTMNLSLDKSLMSTSELVETLRAGAVKEVKRQYPGMLIGFRGEIEEQQKTQDSLVQVFLLALLVIYILLAVPLKSYVQPLLVMVVIPFGVTGAILGHWASGLTLGILSYNGMIALSGVVINDSLLLVSRYNELQSNQTQDRIARIQRASQERLRPVLLTSITTFVGLIPLLQETEAQAQFLIPAAVSLGYGILFATLITLVLIPVLLLIQQDLIRLIARSVANKSTD
jgi:multidrug efflux pump subunit AcrB